MIFGSNTVLIKLDYLTFDLQFNNYQFIENTEICLIIKILMNIIIEPTRVCELPLCIRRVLGSISLKYH